MKTMMEKKHITLPQVIQFHSRAMWGFQTKEKAATKRLQNLDILACTARERPMIRGELYNLSGNPKTYPTTCTFCLSKQEKKIHTHTLLEKRDHFIRVLAKSEVASFLE